MRKILLISFYLNHFGVVHSLPVWILKLLFCCSPAASFHLHFLNLELAAPTASFHLQFLNLEFVNLHLTVSRRFV